MAKSKQPKTLVIKGVSYKIRYFTQDGTGPMRAVLEMSWMKLLKENGTGKGPLQGPEGDEWPVDPKTMKVESDLSIRIS